MPPVVAAAAAGAIASGITIEAGVITGFAIANAIVGGLTSAAPSGAPLRIGSSK